MPGKILLRHIRALAVLVLLINIAGPDRAMARDWQFKVGSRLRREYHKGLESGRLAAESGEIRWRRVLLQFESDWQGSLPPGLRISSRSSSRGGELATGFVDLSLLPQVAASSVVKGIRAEKYFQPCDDPGVLSVRARRVLPKLGVTGRGVLIGVLDSGIDWRHPDFLDPDGRTRIAAILDLSFSDEELAKVDGEFRGPFGGVLITREQINEALAEGTDLPTRDFLSHGTHCAGTAAATAAGALSPVCIYGGVAPGAEIIAVKVTPSQRDSVFSEINILDGLNFLDSLARSLDRPYVCNMSFGESLGPHDGSTMFERYIAGFAGTGTVGRVLVVASGNERHKRRHAAGDFFSLSGPGDSVELSLLVNGQGSHNDGMRVEVWLSPGHPGAQMVLVTPDGERLGPFEDGYGGLEPLVTSEGVLLVENAFGGPNPDNGDRMLSVEFYDSQAWWPDSTGSDISIGQGTWRVILRAGTGSFDAYLYGTKGLYARFGSFVTEMGTVTEPATSQELISVGAYVTRTGWPRLGDPVTGNTSGSEIGKLAYFSGLGPNRRGVIRPELTAPGRLVMSSMSRWAWPPDEPLSMYSLSMVAPDSIHAVSQGTSFACPHVAGICALLLEADPGLSHTQIKNLLTGTATVDSQAVGLADNYWGHGRANAVSAVRQVLGINTDSVSLTGTLQAGENQPADSLVYTVVADFTASPQVLRSVAMNIYWPEQYLCLESLPDSLSAQGEVRLSFDTASRDSGLLRVSGFSQAGVALKDTLLTLVLRPRLAVPVDSVTVGMELVELAGDLEPVRLEGLAVVEQYEG
ncbi:MAG: S8 family serine peptidase, partial [Gemmatimonadota bacterium]|nr:S8 family serine peptidase [Gemmatimonadota bacterium]